MLFNVISISILIKSKRLKKFNKLVQCHCAYGRLRMIHSYSLPSRVFCVLLYVYVCVCQKYREIAPARFVYPDMYMITLFFLTRGRSVYFRVCVCVSVYFVVLFRTKLIYVSHKQFANIDWTMRVNAMRSVFYLILSYVSYSFRSLIELSEPI